MDARQALVDIQADKELKDDFAGTSAHDVEQQIMQMFQLETQLKEVLLMDQLCLYQDQPLE